MFSISDLASVDVEVYRDESSKVGGKTIVTILDLVRGIDDDVDDTGPSRYQRLCTWFDWLGTATASELRKTDADITQGTGTVDIHWIGMSDAVKMIKMFGTVE